MNLRFRVLQRDFLFRFVDLEVLAACGDISDRTLVEGPALQ